MDWKEIDELLLTVSLARLEGREDRLGVVEDNLTQLEKWFAELRAIPYCDNTTNLFEHFENRVIYFQDYFDDKSPQPDRRLRMNHLAAQASLIRNSRNNSLKLANSALRSFGQMVKDSCESEKEEDKKELLRKLSKSFNGMLEGKLPDGHFVSWIQSQNNKTIGNAALLISDVFRVRSQAYGLGGEEELLKLADCDLNIALALLVNQQEEAPPGEDLSPSVTGARMLMRTHDDKTIANFIFSDPSVEKDRTDATLAQYISLLKQKALVDLELGFLYLRSKTKSKARELFNEALESWEEIHRQLESNNIQTQIMEFETRFRSLLLSIAHYPADEELNLPNAVLDAFYKFYKEFNWKSEFDEEAKAALKILPTLNLTQPKSAPVMTALKVILSGEGMTPSKWKEIVRILLDQDWKIDIQDVISKLMSQFVYDDLRAKDQYINVWLEVIHERVADITRHRAPDTHITQRQANDMQSPVEKVLQTLHSSIKADPSVFAHGSSVKTVRVLSRSLEKVSPSCKLIIESILQIADKYETKPGGPYTDN